MVLVRVPVFKAAELLQMLSERSTLMPSRSLNVATLETSACSGRLETSVRPGVRTFGCAAIAAGASFGSFGAAALNPFGSFDVVLSSAAARWA